MGRPEVKEIIDEYPLGIEKKNHLCPSDQVLRSSMVNKLGRYPLQQRHLTIGVTSISRPDGANYLLKTILSLLDNMNDAEKNKTFMAVFLADFDKILKANAALDLLKLFRKENLLHVIEISPEYYPDLSNVRLKYGASQERSAWRSKQNLDFAFLMCYCRKLSTYYLHIEDDVMASPSLIQKMDEFISSIDGYWPILDISTMGHVAKVYQAKDLENVASYFYLMYTKCPWIPQDAYRSGYGYFWGRQVQPNDHVTVKFDQADNTEKVFVDTGSNLAKNDWLRVGVLQANFESGEAINKWSSPAASAQSCGDFATVGSFVEGKANVTFVDSPKIKCLRIVVTQSQAEWLFLREIDVWEKT
ncbi:LOW QUALITY PROTEIN: alpha-1,3-mannosyl-glycoprotein 4-beta-N-acetylglucosaminyltransferase C-like [Stylophora pistillata]|uniref:LOW QUALITY PROTEIN: alpha-1,3-mannosyl-glycoprotein 4-beta-N-acetylglucosaminyltransferase C-like n=1 Tax=Stylophora pistillata TaxID=50429 RepID=UPI000C043BF9|nr:LOW QUALITY PROTEIN: alpha-1,3-mannosyl-glycoprotein 4-beta-N-acetylglucosaminyltransferase C-like [Stylophora pistillata]